MQLDTALPWLVLCLTRGIAARLWARLLKQFGSPENVFRAPLRQLEACELPAATAQAICKKEAFKRAEKELAAIRTIPGCQLVNWSDRNIRKRYCKFTIHRYFCRFAATRKF